MDFRNNKFLVTGASGFIGKHLVEDLLHSGAKVTALARGENLNIKDNNLEILNKNLLEINKNDLNGIDIVIHLAALTDLATCLKDPKKAYEINVLGTINLLENCKNVKKFIYISTLGVYGNPIKIPSNENDPTFPIEPYAATKLAAESFVFSYCNSMKIHFSIARLFNVYGPGQNKNFIIPKIITRSVENKKLELNNLDTTRDFIYVSDVVNAIKKLSFNGSGIYNVGTGIESSIERIVNIIEKLSGKKLSVILDSNQKNKGVSRSRSDPSKIEKEIGWKYTVDLQEGLKMTLDSYKNG